ncbi:MAG: DUF5694 domain-containing protein [Sphingobacterium composti]
MKYLFTIVFIAFISNNSLGQQVFNFKTKFDNAIPVLNLGTFHMGNTSDASKVEFDENDQNNIKQIHEIAKQIAAFKPTIILVEQEPRFNPTLKEKYNTYLKNPKHNFNNPSEIELLAFEVGRLSNSQKIYGIDYKLDYFYSIANYLKNQQDSLTLKKYNALVNENLSLNNINPNNKNVKELLYLNNQPEYLDFLININADLLTTISVSNYKIGAEQASKFYNRNLMMFANMNNIPVNKDDRIFVLMGATHTAFFKDFLRRSPKYKEVSVFEYLK